MKLTIGMILFFVFQATAVISQNTVATINVKNLEMDRFFTEIERQTSVKFLYRYENIEGKRVSVNMENATVDELLEMALQGKGLDFSKMGHNLIVISSVAGSEPSASMQSRRVTGKVTIESGLPLPGVGISIQGTTTGTISDGEGNYSLVVPNDQAVLHFSFIGYTPQDIQVGSQTIINVVMVEEKLAIEEVVVTALGIEKSKKSLTYSTQQVDINSLTAIKDVSLGNALAGKIAGVSITASTGASGVSGDPRIIIRGDRTINGVAQPLVVVDGIQMGTSGGELSGINPDDVQSINVLKGPAASALYGSNAQNGVIVVTTKKGKAGAAKIEVNSVTTFDLPYLYPEFQNEYSQGTGGAFNAQEFVKSWGVKMTGQTVVDWTGKETKLLPQRNNVKDFFRTGNNFTNSFSYSTGTEKSTTYFSYSNTVAQGVLEDNRLTRHNFNMRLNTELLKNLNMDFKITYYRQHLNDKPVTGDDLFSPMFQLLKMPRSIRTDDIKAASYYDNEFSLKQLTWAPGATEVVNPYWSEKGYEAPATTNRVNTFLTLRYDFASWLYVQLRGGMNIANNDEERKTYWDTQYINSGQGNYYTRFGKNQNINGDVLLVFNKELVKNLRLNLNLGAEIKDSQARSMESNSNGLTAENKFALSYAKSLVSTDAESRIQRQSVYGMGQLSYRDLLFLDVTARNDWSSTLPAPHDYFYPSVGLTAVVSDMLTLPELISFAKLRGSYAEVGNGAGFAQIYNTYSAAATGPVGTFYPSGTRMPIDLIPEKTKSWEAGGEIRFMDNRLGIDFTWYKSNTLNQLILVVTPATSGYSQSWINCGNIQNKGIEVMVNAIPVKTSDFDWSIDLNFSKNKNKVVELTDIQKEYEVSSPNLSLGQTWAIVGKPFGEIYTYGYVKNDAGKIIVDSSGLPKIDYSNTPTPNTYLGNFNYDWQSGMTNNLRYKNWNLTFLIDLNYGGVRQSATEAMMLETGTSKASLFGREGGILIDGVKDSDGTPNDIRVDAQTYAAALGGRISNGAGEPFSHEATNSRLREFSVGYTIPLRSNMVKLLRVSAVGRNLFYIYNGCSWFDPDVTYDVDRNGQGAESAFLPGMRTVGVNVRFTL
ncbi:SusC/RagA family TonB-linked outer membrane protein [Gaoshiqia sp. Z1-71]|uniref:SusC/RagA family TonB-linked outer membrane protein n=1 Tax=Gaoshiqia hydrogeniformans TaxID=3290090 RepID=UPI003BF8EDA2